jgi:H+/Cl- antiporter ClcA
VKSALLRTVATVSAYLVAAALGAAVGALFFYVVFFFPSWFMKEDILLLWGWVGTPMGIVGGVAIFLMVAKRLGNWLAQRLKAHVQPEA